MRIGLHELDTKYEGLKVRDRRGESRLAVLLAQGGQYSPVVVVASGNDAGRRFVLIDGYKRLRAAKRAGLDELEATVWEQSEPDALVQLHALQRQRERNGLEDGYLVNALVEEHGMSMDEIAVRLGRSKSWVSRRLGLVKALPRWLQASVSNGEVACYAAVKYLVPLARANRDHAERLAHSLADMQASTRDVGVLYLAWKTGDEKQRELVVSRPEMVLSARSAQTHSDGPEGKVLEYLTQVTALLQRARRGLEGLVLAGLERWSAQQLRRRWRRVEAASAEFSTILQEVCDEATGSGNPTADTSAQGEGTGQSLDCPDPEALAQGSERSAEERTGDTPEEREELGP